ncbi:response regulator [Intrasporangium flavum]|uniref:response regulator n=1 Tax=Intrasporangium flavum TaxID=1428657 RepID=UPI00096FE8A5|nr:response regulator transcription factor [Intrasporangium flavum]
MTLPERPPASAHVTVVLVDDHRLVRAGLRSVLEACGVTVVGEAGDGGEAVAVVLETQPDVVLMDLSMPGVDGVEGTRRVRAAASTPVVVLTSFAESERVRQAIDAGATGYLLKDSEPADVLSAVRAAAAGQVPIDPRVARSLLPAKPIVPAPGHGPVDTTGADTLAADTLAADTLAAERRPAGLSDREREVLAHVARGLANKQVARVLGISERTVKVHLGNVFRRIGVADRTSAALWARDHGIG